jgi:FkbM family methyltransferase
MRAGRFVQVQRKGAGLSWQEQLDELLSEGVAPVREREKNAFDEAAGSCAASIVIYGAGNLGRQTLAGLRDHGVEAIAFCDANPAIWNTQVDGLTVFSPQDAAAQYGRTAVFVVCVWHPDREHGLQSILDYLTSLGAERVVPFLLLFWKYPDTFLPYYFWDLPSRLLADAICIRQAASAFSDESSRDAFTRHLRLRINADFSALPAPAKEPTYFPRDLFTLRPDECFVDCGAYDGDTIREFVKQSGGRFRRIVAFEPDPQTADALQSIVQARPDLNSATTIHRAVLGTAPGVVRFQAAGSLVSAVCEEGGIEVEQTTLDDSVRSAAPTFVKMDIEGSEVAALEGGRKTIREHRPVMAICVYHRPDDLWRIPLLLHELEPGCSLALRMYWMDGFDTVCYAIPPDRRVSR